VRAVSRDGPACELNEAAVITPSRPPAGDGSMIRSRIRRRPGAQLSRRP